MVLSAGSGFGLGANLLSDWLTSPVGSQSTVNPLGPFASFGGDISASGTGDISGLVSSFLLKPIGAGGSAAAATLTSMNLGLPDFTGLASKAGIPDTAQNAVSSTPPAGLNFLAFINGGSTGGIGLQTASTGVKPTTSNFLSGIANTAEKASFPSIGEIMGKNFDLKNLNFGIYNSLSSSAGRFDRLGGLGDGIRKIMNALNSSMSKFLSAR